MEVVNESASLRAIPAPADAVLPESGKGFLGIVMLDTCFPRPPGDVGHPDTFGVPVVRRIVPGAVPRRVVASAESLRGSGLHRPFVEALQALEREGARALTTSCGFLVLLQHELQAAVRVPVVSSSLLQLPALLRAQPQVGVLTISAENLTADYLLAAGVPRERLGDVKVQGVPPDCEFASAILGNRATMDVAQAQRDVVAAARALQAREPALRTLVLECTNMPPHAPAVHEATGWQVLSLRDDPALLAPWRDAA
jgi:hypothetical protein